MRPSQLDDEKSRWRASARRFGQTVTEEFSPSDLLQSTSYPDNSLLGKFDRTPKQRQENRDPKNHTTEQPPVVPTEDPLTVLEKDIRKWLLSNENIDGEKSDQNEYFYLLQMKSGDVVIVIKPFYAQEEIFMQWIQKFVTEKKANIVFHLGLPFIFLTAETGVELANDLLNVITDNIENL